jgi:hypothetical protein
MKNIKLTLTPWQASEVITALENDINPDYTDRDPYNRRIQRIINKIEKAQDEARKDNK